MEFARFLLALFAAFFLFTAVQHFTDATNPVDPKPKPSPVDPIRPRPEPTFDGYDAKVYAAVMKVKSKSRPAECRQLSGDISGIISRIDSGEIADNNAVVTALVAAFKRLPIVWYSHVRMIADDVLKPLTDDGSLSTPQRWGKLLAVAKRGVDRAAEQSTGDAE